MRDLQKTIAELTEKEREQNDIAMATEKALSNDMASLSLSSKEAVSKMENWWSDLDESIDKWEKRVERETETRASEHVAFVKEQLSQLEEEKKTSKREAAEKHTASIVQDELLKKQRESIEKLQRELHETRERANEIETKIRVSSLCVFISLSYSFSLSLILSLSLSFFLSLSLSFSPFLSLSFFLSLSLFLSLPFFLSLSLSFFLSLSFTLFFPPRSFLTSSLSIFSHHLSL